MVSRKAAFLREISDEFIDVLLDRFPASPSPRAARRLSAGWGRYCACRGRDGLWNLRCRLRLLPDLDLGLPTADDPANVARHRSCGRRCGPYSTGGVYVNNLGEEGDERVRAAYGDNLPRLIGAQGEIRPDERLLHEPEHPPKSLTAPRFGRPGVVTRLGVAGPTGGPVAKGNDENQLCRITVPPEIISTGDLTT